MRTTRLPHANAKLVLLEDFCDRALSGLGSTRRYPKAFFVAAPTADALPMQTTARQGVACKTEPHVMAKTESTALARQQAIFRSRLFIK